jgi:REP-associated tyrosine transposase
MGNRPKKVYRKAIKMQPLHRKRKLNRLRNYDYSRSGYYFITLCTKNRIEHFGKIENGKMVLNKYGETAERYWKEIPNHYKNVEIHEFVIMPNHIHGIIIINDNFYDTCLERDYGLLSKIVKSFKKAVTRIIRNQFQDYEFQWQRSFYDQIVHDEISLNKIREYIINNLLKWDLDKDNIGNLCM